MIKSLIKKSSLQGLLESFTDNLRSMYPLTFQELRGRRRPEVFRYALGDERHWLGMEALYETSKAAGFEPEFKFNLRRTSRYSVVRAGRLVLTSSRVRSPDEKIRISGFRNSLAVLNRPSLFSRHQPTGKEDLFGVIVHGCFEQDLKRLGFLRIVLPATNMRPLASLDILRYLAASPVPLGAEEERIQHVAAPRLRQQRKIEEESI